MFYYGSPLVLTICNSLEIVYTGSVKVGDERLMTESLYSGVINGVKDIGIRYLNAQIFSAIRSDQYKSIISNDEFLQHTGIIKRSDIRKIIGKTKFKRENARLSYLDTNEAENLAGNFLTKMYNVGVLVKLRDEPAQTFSPPERAGCLIA